MVGPAISVIIPTLARESLWDAVTSVQRQDQPTELIIVNDSGSPMPPERIPAGARVIDTPGRMGAAHARNVGMQAATGEFIAFLDDDDTWLRGHLAHAVSVLRAHPEADIFSCRALVVRDAGRSRIEPVELTGGRTVSAYFFGPDVWLSRCRRILTPTLVFRRRLADVPMDTSLRMSEDTWWLLTVERTRGATMVQSANVGVVVHESQEREDDRSGQRQRDDIAWARRLDDLVPGAGAAHLASSRARAALRAGRPREVVRLAHETLSFDGGWRWLPALAIQTAGAGAFWARRRLADGRPS